MSSGLLNFSGSQAGRSSFEPSSCSSEITPSSTRLSYCSSRDGPRSASSPAKTWTDSCDAMQLNSLSISVVWLLLDGAFLAVAVDDDIALLGVNQSLGVALTGAGTGADGQRVTHGVPRGLHGVLQGSVRGVLDGSLRDRTLGLARFSFPGGAGCWGRRGLGRLG